jgi:hypothetical protein
MKHRRQKMERTGDPVRDADHYNREMEERPIKEHEGTITITIATKCYGRNGIEAKDDLEERAGDLKDYIECLKDAWVEVEEMDVKVGEEIE